MKPFRAAPQLLIASLLLTSFALAPLTLRAAPEGDFYDEPGVRLLNQPVADYRARRQRLMEQTKDGVLVILGNVEESMGVEGRYRQNNWMAYLTGVRTPGAALMLVPGGLASEGGAKEIVFIPPRNLEAERWTGVQLAPGAEAARTFGAERVLSSDALWPKLKEAAPLKLYTFAPTRAVSGFLREYEFAERARRELPNVEVVSVVNTIAEMRKAKSPTEVTLLQKAIDITGEAQRDIAANLRPGMYEFEIQALLEAAFTRNGSERPGFPSIVGSGIYSTILHYEENHKKIEDGDLVVCDIGAEYSLYTADITRTYPANGKFTPRQRAVYQLVLDTQSAIAAYWKPGMTHSDLHRFTEEYLRKSALRARDTDGREYTMDHFFIHGFGHYLGMDVHDVGNSGLPMRPGEVFTIEPGIYIQSERLGVRIEDDYLVTPENTLRKMSEKIPSAPDEIERLMAARKR